MPRVRREARRHRVRAPYPEGVDPPPDWLQAILDATNEATWQKQVLAAADTFGWHYFHDQATNTPRKCTVCGAYRRGPRNVKGFPDLVLLRGPRMIVAELKDEYGTVTDEQRAWLDWFAAIPGVEVFTWRPRDSEAVTRTLAA